MAAIPSQQVCPLPPSADTMIRMALRKVQTVATLPEITAEIIRIAENPATSANTLKKIISNDPALVTRILKVVNSAFYGLSGQIKGIDRAIVILGFNEIKAIAVATGLGELLKGAGLGGPFTARDLWRHCVSVAIAARELAKISRKVTTPEAFLAGLIHDVGLLVHLQVNGAKLTLVCDTVRQRLEKMTGPVNFCAVERSIIGVDHEQLGQALTEQWHFPAMYQQVIGSHHHPKSAISDHELVMLVHISDTLVSKKDNCFNLTARSQDLDEAELKALGLKREDLDKVSAGLDAMVEDVMKSFA